RTVRKTDRRTPGRVYEDEHANTFVGMVLQGDDRVCRERATIASFLQQSSDQTTKPSAGSSPIVTRSADLAKTPGRDPLEPRDIQQPSPFLRFEFCSARFSAPPGKCGRMSVGMGWR